MLLIRQDALVTQQVELWSSVASLSIVNQVANKIEVALLSDLPTDRGLNVCKNTVLCDLDLYRAIQRCKRTTAAKISELINLSLRIYSEVARWVIGANKFAEPNKASSCRRDCKCCVCLYIFFSLRDLEKKNKPTNTYTL